MGSLFFILFLFASLAISIFNCNWYFCNYIMYIVIGLTVLMFDAIICCWNCPFSRWILLSKAILWSFWFFPGRQELPLYCVRLDWIPLLPFKSKSWLLNISNMACTSNSYIYQFFEHVMIFRIYFHTHFSKSKSHISCVVIVSLLQLVL